MIEKVRNHLLWLSEKHKFHRLLDEVVPIFGGRPVFFCEIGVGSGINAVKVFRRLNVVKAVLIDPYCDYGVVDGNPLKDWSRDRRRAHSRLGKFNDLCVWLEMISDDALDVVPGLDFLFISGNWSADFLRRDLEGYGSLVREGGVVSGNAYTTYNRKRVINRFADGGLFTVCYPNYWYYIKIKEKL